MAEKSVSFSNVQLLKDQTLGIGSYGKVCKAKCDDLLCAAKLMHETLFDPTAQWLVPHLREHRLPMRRFEQECEFLSSIRHPNIIQYLGIHRDPDTGLPALLMELMDDSLTHFLENSTQPIPYHVQVNVCHDITLALSFLHSNNIIHRDLSSNNILLRGNILAKVTDFGMARLVDQNPHAAHRTFTVCPGTDVYMPPEAVQDEPEYTEKIDCFSFGVITLQILTRQFPKPGNRRKRMETNPPGLPRGTFEMVVSEIDRRQNHISEIDPSHALLQVSLDCLKDRAIERPSSCRLCERMAALKESPEYSESVRAAEAQGLQQMIQSQRSLLEEKDRIIAQKHQDMVQKDETLRQKDEIITAGEQQVRQQQSDIDQLERQLGCVNQQLEESERVTTQFQGRVAELEQLKLPTDRAPGCKQQSSSQTVIKMTWREGSNAPCTMSSIICSAVADDTNLYIKAGDKMVYAYNASTSAWSQLPDSPTHSCTPVIVNNLLTLVGGICSGWLDDYVTDKLFSLTEEGSGKKWVEKFPQMPTKRFQATALCTETALIVAGGRKIQLPTDATLSFRMTIAQRPPDLPAFHDIVPLLRTVEVMNTETLQWFTAANLPGPLLPALGVLGDNLVLSLDHPNTPAPGVVCGDLVYLLSLDYPKIVYNCSLRSLIQSCFSGCTTVGVWNEVTAPPVTYTTLVSIHGQLLTIGGMDSKDNSTAAVHVYNPASDSWEVISHMTMPRSQCLVAVLPNNQLIVVGGVENNITLSSVEFATCTAV